MSSVLLLTRGSAIAVDAVVIVLTWIKTFRHWRHMRQLHINVSVTDVLIRDGMDSFFKINFVFIVAHFFVECRIRGSIFLVSHFLSSLISRYLNVFVLPLHRAFLAMNIAQITTWNTIAVSL